MYRQMDDAKVRAEQVQQIACELDAIEKVGPSSLLRQESQSLRPPRVRSRMLLSDTLLALVSILSCTAFTLAHTAAPQALIGPFICGPDITSADGSLFPTIVFME